MLDGLRVLDLGHYLAGPLTARLLAEHGADVIRIDRPDRGEQPSDAYLQAGKRRVTLDLKRPDDRAYAERLATTVDVVIENFRPGVADRLGVGWKAVSATNPSVVYCSLPGFGSPDQRASVPGWEGVVGAATGNCRVRVGEAPDDWDYGRPTYCSLPLASNFAAVLAATAIVAALHRREASGQGARVEVPLFDATFELIGHAGAYPLERGFSIEDPLTTNGSGAYECADGRFVQFNPIGSTMRFLTWFFEDSGHPEWIGEGLNRPATFAADPQRAVELRQRLAQEFATRPAAEWEELGMRAGVPLSMIRTTEEWWHTPHALESGQVVDVIDPLLGAVRLAGSPVTVAGASAPALVRHVPDQDRDDLLAERSVAAPEPARPVEPADAFDPFAGLRVVDLTQILAGPSAGRALAEYGADVIKVNAPHVPIGGHGIINRGKRSILIDLQRSEGVELLWELLADADVVTQNFPPGTAERYGIGYDQVHARFPHLVYVSVSCYGRGGRWARGRGYEVQGQAATGIMERTGRGGIPGVLGPYNPLDYGTGAMAAFACALGIYHRGRTGDGLHVSTSLAQTGTFHQAALPTIARPDGNSPEPSGRAALGRSAIQRFYAAADGWVFVGATAGQRTELLDALALTPDDPRIDDDGDPAGVLADSLAAAIRALPRREVAERLTARDIGAHPVVRLPGLLDEPYVRSSGLRVEEDSPEVGAVVMPGPAVIVDGRRIPAKPGSSGPGGEARAVLADHGRHDIDELAQRWVVQVDALPPGWPVYARWPGCP